MIRISNSELSSGINLSNKVYRCPNSHNCLWMKRTRLFTGFLPRACLKENCPAVIFRKKFEGDSPSCYAEALRFSQWWCASALATIDKRREIDRKKLERRVDDLDTYGQLVILIVHPIDLATGEIAFLKPKEIEILEKSWSLEERNRTIQTMREINPAWLAHIKSVMRYIVSNQTYYDAIFYLVYLFLKGLEKNQLPDLEIMPQEEKEKFFLEIEKSLST